LENTVRTKMTYEGLPIRFDVREREQRAATLTGKAITPRSATRRKAPGKGKTKEGKRLPKASKASPDASAKPGGKPAPARAARPKSAKSSGPKRPRPKR
jgi:hypothetical protein